MHSSEYRPKLRQLATGGNATISTARGGFNEGRLRTHGLFLTGALIDNGKWDVSNMRPMLVDNAAKRVACKQLELSKDDVA